jgi:chaperone required for assembly of F1-ATPase
MTADDQRSSGHEEKARRPGQEPRAPLPKRFYKSVDVAANAAGSFQIKLDGRAVKTPKKRPLQVPGAAFADAIAGEWRAQTAVIDPASMPLTRIANTAIDAVSDAMPVVAADVVAYAGSDLLCYRAEGPSPLIARQAAVWDPVLAWAQSAHGAQFMVSQGVMPIEQPDRALAAIAKAVAPLNAFQLSAVHVLTTLTGSALLAIAHASDALPLDAMWAAAHVDEDWQIEMWGPDADAAVRRALRRVEFEAAAKVLALLRKD